MYFEVLRDCMLQMDSDDVFALIQDKSTTIRGTGWSTES